MKYLLKFSKNYKAECILGPIFKLIEASLELSVPLVMKSIIDIGIKNGDSSYIIKMSLFLVLLGILGLSSTVTAQYFSAKAAVGITSKIKRALFDKIQRFSYNELDGTGSATLITRMTGDANQVQSGINLTLRLLLRSPFIVFGAMIMAFTVDVKGAITFAVIIPLLTIVVFAIMLISIPLYRKVQEGLDGVLNLSRENLSGVRVVRAFCREENECKEFSEKTDLLLKYQMFVGKISALMNPVTYVLINMGIIAVIYSGAIRVDNGIITQGAVVSLYNYMLLILTELIKLANLIITISKSVACENRIESILELRNENNHKGTDTVKDYSIRFENVSFKYGNAAENSINGIDFSLESGETLGIIGGTGSGKTTLTCLIPAFYYATEGRVLIGGKDVKDIDKKELISICGVVPQKAVLFKGTIKENLLMGNKDATDDELFEALKNAVATDVVEVKENGINEIIEEGGKNLSGGQKQRLTVARALVKKPKILILDDSASALDLATDAALRSSIKNLPYKPTVIIVSQRAASVMNADKIIVLDDGKEVGIGTHKQLLENCEVYKEIYYSQFDVKEGAAV